MHSSSWQSGGLIRSSLTSCGNKAKVQQCHSLISCTLYLGKQCHNLALVLFQAIFCALLVNILLNQPRHTDKEKGSVSSEEKCSINNSVHQERVFANPPRWLLPHTLHVAEKSIFCSIVTSPFCNPWTQAVVEPFFLPVCSSYIKLPSSILNLMRRECGFWLTSWRDQEKCLISI